MKIIRLSIFCLLSASIITSCVKKQFDNPTDTSHYDPLLPTNASLKDLVAITFSDLPSPGSFKILGDTTVSGIVIGDDRSGNLYKQIVIEDSLGGGMVILLDKTYLYADYPVGRKIYVKTKGLYLTNYKGLPEIAYYVDSKGATSGIPTTLISNYLVKASYPHTITPKVVDIVDLISNPYQYLNTLIQLSDMQFDNASAGVPYSAATSSTNRTITNCAHSGQIVMYNSSYATFQPAITPTGNGSISGIVSIYLSTPQFTLRDTTDVQFTGARCP
jgi:hypothetical protein